MADALAGCRHDDLVTPTGFAPVDRAPIPAETAGPFPGDGSNGPNLLAQAGAVRSDIRASLAPATGGAEGVPLEFRLALCPPRADAAIDVWHCDRDGRYSMYSDGVTDETFLRGVQETGADGVATFRSSFPGCYPRRWPHIHFEVYASLADASAGAAPIATSRLAFPPHAAAAAGYVAELPVGL